MTGLTMTGLTMTGLTMTGLTMTGLTMTGLTMTGLTTSAALSSEQGWFGRRQRFRTILRRIRELPLPPAAKILELGPGAGGVAVMLAERGYCVEAVDPASAPGAGNSGSWDAGNLPFADGTFDLVMAIGALPPDLKRARKPIREWARVLKPGGFTVANTEREVSIPLRGRLSALLKKTPFRADCVAHEPRAAAGYAIDGAISAAGLEKIPLKDEAPFLIIARKSNVWRSIQPVA